MSLFGSYLEENFGIDTGDSIPFSISESVDLSNSDYMIDESDNIGFDLAFISGHVLTEADVLDSILMMEGTVDDDIITEGVKEVAEKIKNAIIAAVSKVIEFFKTLIEKISAFVKDKFSKLIGSKLHLRKDVTVTTLSMMDLNKNGKSILDTYAMISQLINKNLTGAMNRDLVTAAGVGAAQQMGVDVDDKTIKDATKEVGKSIKGQITSIKNQTKTIMTYTGKMEEISKQKNKSKTLKAGQLLQGSEVKSSLDFFKATDKFAKANIKELTKTKAAAQKIKAASSEESSFISASIAFLNASVSYYKKAHSICMKNALAIYTAVRLENKDERTARKAAALKDKEES